MAILTSMTCTAVEDLLNLTKTISKHFLKEESCQTSRELAEKINCDQKTIINYLHSMGFAEKLRVWVPHELSENNKKIAFKLLLNIAPIIEQHAVTNSAFCTESSREMRNGAYI